MAESSAFHIHHLFASWSSSRNSLLRQRSQHRHFSQESSWHSITKINWHHFLANNIYGEHFQHRHGHHIVEICQRRPEWVFTIGSSSEFERWRISFESNQDNETRHHSCGVHQFFRFCCHWKLVHKRLDVLVWCQQRWKYDSLHNLLHNQLFPVQFSLFSPHHLGQWQRLCPGHRTIWSRDLQIVEKAAWSNNENQRRNVR